MIFHFVEKRIFEDGLRDGYYINPSLATRGFIHSVTKENMYIIAERYLMSQEPIIILVIDESKIKADIIYEESKGIIYPHIYGKIERNAIINVLPLLKDETNHFILNDEIKNIY